MAIDTKHFKDKIQKEFELVEGELKGIGRRNPANPADWEAVETDTNLDSADPNDVADNIDSFEENTALVKQLEIRWNELKNALARIEAGTYGVCEVCGKPIESERLEANPAATTCIAHKK